MNNNEIYSVKIPAGKRTYFIDVKETSKGSNYLKISENKQNDNGNSFERHNIMIFEEDITKIVDALHKALEHFPNYKKP